METSWAAHTGNDDHPHSNWENENENNKVQKGPVFSCVSSKVDSGGEPGCRLFVWGVIVGKNWENGENETKEGKLRRTVTFVIKSIPVGSDKSIKISWKVKGVYILELSTPKKGGRGIIQWRVPQHFWVAHTHKDKSRKLSPSSSHWRVQGRKWNRALVVRRDQLEVIWSYSNIHHFRHRYNPR